MEDGISLGGSADAGNPTGGGVGLSHEGSDGQTDVTNGWTAGLQDEDNRALVVAKGWDGPDAALAAYKELESYQGKSVAMPGEGASEDDWRAFHQKLGMPDEADKYEVPAIDDLDENAVTGLKRLFHDAGLNQRQAAAVFDSLVGNYRQATEMQAQQQVAAVTGARDALVAAWGPEAGETFKTNVDMARRAVAELGGDALFAELRSLGALTAENKIAAPGLAKALAEAGEQLFAEDTLVSGSPNISTNPWAADSQNLSLQGEIVRKDPARARALIRAAGLRPEEYGLKAN